MSGIFLVVKYDRMPEIFFLFGLKMIEKNFVHFHNSNGNVFEWEMVLSSWRKVDLKCEWCYEIVGWLI